MRNILFAALLLGCVLFVTGQVTGEFEFHDSNGNCWRCTPGNTCERCNSDPVLIPRVDPIEWPSTCPALPDCEQLRAEGRSLSVKFPSINSRNYFVCRPDPEGSSKWIAVERECPCETLFTYSRQRCDWAFEWDPHCINLQRPVTTEDCPGQPEPTEVPVDPETTTQQPCMCIPWWPCWCNPCWHMPCGSCSGCVG